MNMNTSGSGFWHFCFLYVETCDMAGKGCQDIVCTLQVLYFDDGEENIQYKERLKKKCIEQQVILLLFYL